jgi:hypothetical protein
MEITDIEFQPHTGTIDQILMNEADGLESLEVEVTEMDNSGIGEGILSALGGMGI